MNGYIFYIIKVFLKIMPQNTDNVHIFKGWKIEDISGIVGISTEILEEKIAEHM